MEGRREGEEGVRQLNSEEREREVAACRLTQRKSPTQLE